ncbi:hypothetical protein ACFOWM_05610 [Ferruginibacter yonginensis]|uniref:UspA domain-containing protein n=1 Tax=Ferruginibacter yonginensis TaxID=1310416 RepID=A0ABV8QRF7_9BACT
MLNILIPTDFTAASLQLVEQAIKQSDKKVNIVLFHAFELPSSPHDLLSPSYKKPEYSLINEPFRQACKQLKDSYPNIINKINISCMQGNTKALFRNFIDAKDIDFICCPVAYNYMSIHPQSINPTTLFKKSGVPVVKELTTSSPYVFTSKTIANTTAVTA